jgi:hypothetical protein
MARETKSAAIQGDLQRLSGTMELNKDLLPDLEPFRLKLAGVVTQTFDLSKQQAAMKASKQESSKQLRKFLVDGQRIADVVRTAVRDHFGPDSEKLTEFGVKPFRGRKVKPPTAPPPTTTTPSTPAGTTPTASTTTPAVPAGPAPPAK